VSRIVTWFYCCQHVAGQWTIDEQSRLQELTTRSFVKLCCAHCLKSNNGGAPTQKEKRPWLRNEL
jgi:hypothetical protein